MAFDESDVSADLIEAYEQGNTELSCFGPQHFESQLRNLTAADIPDACDWVQTFFQEQQAYALTMMYGLSRADFVRLDFATWSEA